MSGNQISTEWAAEVERSARKLLAYCRENDWSGYDPYDALNSRWVERVPVFQSRIPALVLTQLLKRSPINVRGLLAIPKTQNAKAMGLFVSSLLRAPALAGDQADNLIEQLTTILRALRSPGSRYWCWGYSFPWRGRNMLVPKSAPNLVCTQFAAVAFLDRYERSRNADDLSIAVSAAEFILDELYWSDGESVAGFSYPLPSIRNQVHNANLLASSFLCRIFRHTGRRDFLEPALKVARQSAGMQLRDGSWPYGESPTQKWVDNFHTGYNLCALQSIACDAQTEEFDACIRRGFAFYRSHFFREDGAPRYFHNRTYPIDIHCVAQSLITLAAFSNLQPDNLKIMESLFRWTMKNMWDERGFFYYRVLPWKTIRTPYMRWSQAWMLRALSEVMWLQQGREHQGTALREQAALSV